MNFSASSVFLVVYCIFVITRIAVVVAFKRTSIGDLP